MTPEELLQHLKHRVDDAGSTDPLLNMAYRSAQKDIKRMRMCTSVLPIVTGALIGTSIVLVIIAVS